MQRKMKIIEELSRGFQKLKTIAKSKIHLQENVSKRLFQSKPANKERKSDCVEHLSRKKKKMMNKGKI